MFSQPPHLAMRRASSGTRSPIGVPLRLLPSGLSALGRSSRPGFHGTWQDVRSGTVAPTGERRPRVLTRALPAPACPSPGNAPPGPVVVPVSMMPEAARVRSVSFRARAPHSLRIREYPRPKASFTERDSLNHVPEMGTKVNGIVTRPPPIRWSQRSRRCRRNSLVTPQLVDLLFGDRAAALGVPHAFELTGDLSQPLCQWPLLAR